MSEDHIHEEILDKIDDHVSYLANVIIKLTARVKELENSNKRNVAERTKQ